MESRDLIATIQRGDVAGLTRIPGVGKKTAERIVVELRDRLPKPVDGGDVGTRTPKPADLLRDDLTSALTNLGYHRQAVDRAIEKALGNEDQWSFEAALRAALKELSRA
jgi:Holliday junction DNA helicase RuvA